MTAPQVLVLDAGTSGFRASVYGIDGGQVAAATRAWSAHTPPELAPFGKAYDPDALWTAIDGAAREAIAAAEPASIAAVSVTGQRIACGFLDAQGRTLYLGPNGDVRALAAGDLSDLDADAIYARTGRFPPWMYAPARLRWWQHARAETEVARVVSLPGWIRAQLGARAHVTDPTLGADLLMVELDGLRLAPIASGVDEAAWPALLPPEAQVGTVSVAVAERWGLSPAVAVAAGIADTQAALLGTLGGGDLLVGGGSAPLVRPTADPERDPKGRLWTSPTATGYMLEANLGEMGTMYDWLRGLLGLEGFDALDALARSASIGCRAMSAHLGPRAMDLRALNTGRPAAMLMPFGQTMGNAPAGRAELARAYLESCAFATRAGRAWLDEVTAPGPLTIVGGMARSAQLATILAGALGEPVRVGAPDATARGAAMVGAVMAEQFATLADAREVMSVRSKIVEPVDADQYDDAFERWLEREEQLEEL